MGAFIARQPNGLLCRFSTVVDTITHSDLTDEEYIEMCAEEAREKARLELERGVRPFQWVLDQFRPMNDTVEQFNEYLKMMGSDVQLDPKDYDYDE
jgi:hypothetical protein